MSEIIVFSSDFFIFEKFFSNLFLSFKQNIKLALLLFAIFIGIFSLWYSNSLVEKLQIEEKKKIEQWAEAQEKIADGEDISFLAKIIESNTTIPVILTDNDHIIGFRNIDSNLFSNNKQLEKYFTNLKNRTKPIPIKITENYTQYLYYDESSVLKQLKVYPIYQLGIIGFFIVISYFAFSFSRKAEENKVWVGLAKETAHQLGTPMSSLMAWIDLMELDISTANEDTFKEMRKDIDRLKVITERFSKIGSKPSLERTEIVSFIQKSLDYMKDRSPQTVEYSFQTKLNEYFSEINHYLFEWVVENLCKNAIDAMEGKGKINVLIFNKYNHIYIEVSDNGKGIPSSIQKRIFKPGFTTKKRGWGLGLSLVKRIIVEYHKGDIFVKESIANKKTTFRIILKQIP